MKSLNSLLVILLFIPVLAFAQKTLSGVTYDAQIIRVSDGDTIVISAPFLHESLKPELTIRIFEVDTPEKGARAKCENEKRLGKEAFAFTKKAVASTQKHKYVLYGWDNDGRVLGDVILDGVSLRSELIKNGFATEYYSDEKQSWCL